MKTSIKGNHKLFWVVSTTTLRCKNPSLLTFCMYLHAWKKIYCCEEVSFVVEKKVLHFWRWEAEKKNQAFRGEGYTHPRMPLLWWKDTGTPSFVKPTLVWVFTALIRYCWHFSSQPPIFVRRDQILSLMFGLVDITNNLLLNKKDAVRKSSPRRRFCCDDFSNWYELFTFYQSVDTNFARKKCCQRKSNYDEKGKIATIIFIEKNSKELLAANTDKFNLISCFFFFSKNLSVLKFLPFLLITPPQGFEFLSEKSHKIKSESHVKRVKERVTRNIQSFCCKVCKHNDFRLRWSWKTCASPAKCGP